MTGTRYCSTCGTLLSEGAAICGECGARYQPSPYERRATDAPGAWSPPPRQRSRETDVPAGAAEEEGIELITADSLRPARPGATALRGEEQYDRVMVTQPPMNQPGPPVGAPGAPGSPARAPEPGPTDQPAAAPLDPPLDGCVTASPLKRFLAALIDSVLASLVSVPFLVGAGLLLFSEDPGLLAQILIGVGVALPLAYHLVMVWLVGAKGFTIGKLILGLRVTRTSQGGPLGFLRSLGRWALYGLISLIMALSIFLDPRKQLRGFHDRAVDSVVVDVKEGRDPLKPRPDDFERAGAEHYLGAPSVAVGAHENLLAEPGAAWRDQGAGPAQPADGGAPQHGAPPQGMPPQSAPEQGAPQQGAPQQGAPSPYAHVQLRELRRRGAREPLGVPVGRAAGNRQRLGPAARRADPVAAELVGRAGRPRAAHLGPGPRAGPVGPSRAAGPRRLVGPARGAAPGAVLGRARSTGARPDLGLPARGAAGARADVGRPVGRSAGSRPVLGLTRSTGVRAAGARPVLGRAARAGAVALGAAACCSRRARPGRHARPDPDRHDR
jgi:uncharacterized RDD family membrane protein YckC